MRARNVPATTLAERVLHTMHVVPNYVHVEADHVLRGGECPERRQGSVPRSG
eukprot:CAMPEP_0173202574 /NCGR_PEP_ID=MMETSP1141-20130122/19049_1 /TAXON_ID=483371 /ORGANISM="non described non described, Strain CCMP2298" /LENGTH=51 /DNA_ID=CAMNT_0014127955 /DNA_START=134 /DNA_END=289 /DNA_ORIENTATION=+